GRHGGGPRPLRAHRRRERRTDGPSRAPDGSAPRLGRADRGRASGAPRRDRADRRRPLDRGVPASDLRKPPRAFLARGARVKTTPSTEALSPVLENLRKANAAFAARYPGETARRQPVHTVYGGAQVFQSDTAPRLGTLAIRALEEYAPDARVFA